MRSYLQSVVCALGLAMCAILACAGESVPGAASVYRCGNAYTNQPEPGQRCQSLRTANVTVIEGTQVQASTTMRGPALVAPGGVQVDSTEQRQRDTQARAVLQAEWQRAQAQHQQLLAEWNQGQPERRADEHRQPQKYQERVAQLRAAVQRSSADLAGLQRELARLPQPVPAGAP